MNWDDSLSDLLDLLVRNYPDPLSARDVAEKAGLQTKFLRLNAPSDSVWMDILRQARNSPTGLQDIARVAQRDFPNIDFPILTLVRQIDEYARLSDKHLFLMLSNLNVLDYIVEISRNDPELKEYFVARLVESTPHRTDERERYWGYIALGKLGGTRAKEALCRGLKDPDGYARRGAEDVWELLVREPD